MNHQVSDQAVSDQAVVDRATLSKLSRKILNNPILFRRLGDRIYALLKEDTLNQCDRNGQARRLYS